MTATSDHHIPNLHVEISDPTTTHASVWLQQDQGGTFHNVTLHTSQVRFLAEQLGLLAPSGPGADEHRARMFRMLDLIHEKASRLRDSLDEGAGHEVDAQAAAGLADFAAFMRADFASTPSGEVSA